MLAFLDTFIPKFLLVPVRRIWLSVGVALFLLLFLLCIITWKANDSIVSGSHKYFEEIASSLSNAVSMSLQATSNSLVRLSREHGECEDSHKNRVQVIAEHLGVENLILVDTQGMGRDHDEQQYELADNAAVQKALHGREAIFDSLCIPRAASRVAAKNNHLALAVPIVVHGESRGALVAELSDTWGNNILTTSILDGAVAFVLFDSAGHILVRTDDFLKLGVAHQRHTQVQDLLRELKLNKIAAKVDELKTVPLRTPLNFRYNVGGTLRDCMMQRVQGHDLYIYVMSLGEFGTEEFLAVSRIVNISAICVILLLIAICIFLLLVYRYCRFLAFEDPITGGMTRARFEIELTRQLRASIPVQYVFVCININKFKLFNEFFGRSQGDRLLRRFYQNLDSLLPAGTHWLCRSGIDEFDLLCEGMTVQSLLTCLDRAVTVTSMKAADDSRLSYSFTIRAGVRIIEDARADYIMIKSRAGIAMERANIAYGSSITYALYDEQNMEQAVREKSIENFMQTSLAAGDFFIVLQPKVLLLTGQVCGAEALVRWQHPTLGYLSPDEFIPIFERNGFIRNVDAWVVETVCKLMSSWHARGYSWLPVSVNLSRIELTAEGTIAARLTETADRYGVPHQYLEFEITETLYSKEPAFIQSVIDAIRDAGFRCSLDDFGSGYSSLNLLSAMRIDTLKIDRSFFSSPDLVSTRDRTVIKVILDLARELGIRVVAEGIETVAHRDFVFQHACAVAQGFLFAKPLPVAEFERVTFRERTALGPGFSEQRKSGSPAAAAVLAHLSGQNQDSMTPGRQGPGQQSPGQQGPGQKGYDRPGAEDPACNRS